MFLWGPQASNRTDRPADPTELAEEGVRLSRQETNPEIETAKAQAVGLDGSKGDESRWRGRREQVSTRMCRM